MARGLMTDSGTYGCGGVSDDRTLAQLDVGTPARFTPPVMIEPALPPTRVWGGACGYMNAGEICGQQASVGSSGDCDSINSGMGIVESQDALAVATCDCEQATPGIERGVIGKQNPTRRAAPRLPCLIEDELDADHV
jgi:hypothetical protein